MLFTEFSDSSRIAKEIDLSTNTAVFPPLWEGNLLWGENRASVVYYNFGLQSHQPAGIIVGTSHIIAVPPIWYG